MDSNNNVEDEDEDDDEEEDNGSDNNISVTSSPVAVRRTEQQQHQKLSSSIDEEDNEATNIIITNNATTTAATGHQSSPGGGLLRRKSQSDSGHRSRSSSPTTAGAFTSLIQRNSDTLHKAHGQYLKTSELLAGFSSAGHQSATSAGGGNTPQVPSTFNPSLAAQLFQLQTSQPLLPPPSQWLYTQLYGANYGDFSWFRNSLSGAQSAFKSISSAAVASASVSPEQSVSITGEGKFGRVTESDGERSLDRLSPPVTSTSKRSPSPGGDDGNVTEEEGDVRQPLAKKLDTMGAFTRAAVGVGGVGEKQGTTDVWRPY